MQNKCKFVTLYMQLKRFSNLNIWGGGELKYKEKSIGFNKHSINTFYRIQNYFLTLLRIFYSVSVECVLYSVTKTKYIKVYFWQPKFSILE